MANQKTLLGDIITTEDKAISISVERYNELIKKEVFYDELTRSHDTVVVLNERLQIKEEDKNSGN